MKTVPCPGSGASSARRGSNHASQISPVSNARVLAGCGALFSGEVLMALDNIHLEAFRDDGPDYPVEQGLTFPALVLVACLVLAVGGLALIYLLTRVWR
jgi:hypothetical protein